MEQEAISLIHKKGGTMDILDKNSKINKIPVWPLYYNSALKLLVLFQTSERRSIMGYY